MNKYYKKQNIFSLQGFGEKTKARFFSKFGINQRLNPQYLKNKQFVRLEKIVKKKKMGHKLLEDIKKRISYQISNKTFKGSRHKLGYPSRGQRTHTNAKTTKKSKY